MREQEECHIPEWAALMGVSVPERACEERRLTAGRTEEA